ncbi:MAG: D-alanyl-D-alanine carboxypeptidase [Actinobacteria bacterium]|nr:D-alanyl-D-alanine carboxypeptidase [Actinomycetota bacterium]
MDNSENHGRTDTPEARERLSQEERRRLAERRIRELRARRRRERRAAMRRRRMAVSLCGLSFLLLFLAAAASALASGGGEQTYISARLPASNLSTLEEMARPEGTISAPDIPAAAAALLDPGTGDMLYLKNADQSLPMASTTKIMTALLALERASPGDTVTVSETASAVGESSAWLEKGETLTVEQLTYAVLVQSANDAAAALAEHVAGSQEAFVGLMNEKAADLGLANTHFSNPHGLDAAGHHTSARDLANLAAAAMRNPEFRKIVSTRTFQLPWPGHPGPRVFENHNKLLKLYPYATGIKTGYTAKAGKCLVASAEKDGRELISVILNGGESYWDQTIALMEYGFNDFARVEYAYAGQPLAEVEVGDFPRRNVHAVGSRDLVFTVRRDRLDAYREADLAWFEWVPYPVAAGQEVGYLSLGDDGEGVNRVSLVSDVYRNRPSFLVRFFAFIAAVFARLLEWIRWLVPGW